MKRKIWKTCHEWNRTLIDEKKNNNKRIGWFNWRSENRINHLTYEYNVSCFHFPQVPLINSIHFYRMTISEVNTFMRMTSHFSFHVPAVKCSLILRTETQAIQLTQLYSSIHNFKRAESIFAFDILLWTIFLFFFI